MNKGREGGARGRDLYIGEGMSTYKREGAGDEYGEETRARGEGGTRKGRDERKHEETREGRYLLSVVPFDLCL